MATRTQSPADLRLVVQWSPVKSRGRMGKLRKSSKTERKMGEDYERNKMM
jgi:hypothetical protein